MSKITRLVASALTVTSLLGFARAHDGDPKLLDKKPAYTGPGIRQPKRLGADGNIQPGTMAYFPARGIQLLSWVSLGDLGLPGSANGNSCFGYTSPSGREYAILGESDGTTFVEITQPSNPVVVERINGPDSMWRDMKTFSTYCYAASEGGGGIQVMDLANIDSGVVTLVNTVNDDATGATHTLALNTDSGYLYRSGGGSQGIRIYNLNSNPAAPQRVGQWSDRYVHEPQIVSYTSGPAAGKEIAFCCGGFNGGFNSTGIYVVDVTNKAAPALVQYLPYGNSQFAHQAWLSPDRQFMYLNDEVDDGNLGITSVTRIFNASNPLALTVAGTFTNGSSAIDHNLYTKDTRIFESNYCSGLRIFDATSPTAPVEIAYFDTRPEDNATSFNGLWNNYAYFDSGVVVGSDLERGLFVWWPGTSLLTFSYPNGKPSAVHPGGELVPLHLDVNGNGAYQPGTAQIHVDDGSGFFVASNLIDDGGGDFRATFPATQCGNVVRYYFTAQSTNGVTWTDPVNAPDVVHSAVSTTSQSVAFSDDFQANLGWSTTAAGDNATAGIWTRVDPNGTIAQPADDHSASGSLCFVTGQGTPTGALGAADVDSGRTTLTTPVLDLSGVSNPVIEYWRWYSNDQGSTGNADTFRVDASNNNGGSWVNVETIGPSGPLTAGGWHFHQFRLSDFVAPSAQVRVRFIAEDANPGHIVEAGIDDFRVTGNDCVGTQAFCFGDGSGSACPCGNTGAVGHGCANSFGLSAQLATSGTPSVGSDTLVLNGTDMPSGTLSLYFQGTAAINGGLGTIGADGLRCAGGSQLRLGIKTTILGGSSNYPEGGDLSVSVKGAVGAPGTRYYQIWYRNSASFCTSETTNYSNGVIAVWGL